MLTNLRAANADPEDFGVESPVLVQENDHIPYISGQTAAQFSYLYNSYKNNQKLKQIIHGSHAYSHISSKVRSPSSSTGAPSVLERSSRPARHFRGSRPVRSATPVSIRRNCEKIQQQ